MTEFDLLRGFGVQILPRILTQIDRDPRSTTYGSCDRNYWHYKMRDFPSIILQQAGEALWHASELEEFAHYADRLHDLTAGVARHWADRACRYGAFEEYYPWERGYPPLAFSSLSVAKLVRAGAVPLDDVETALAIAGRQLRSRFESQAANQQLAGFAALATIEQILPGTVPETDLRALMERSLSLQDEEGWFMEYDGPDTGYLSVALDCLWDAYDATDWEPVIEAGHRAMAFIGRMVTACDGSPGMLNSRNTDYIVPYGLFRSAVDGPPEVQAVAASSIKTLYGGLDDMAHPLRAVDDRYLTHYIGVSVMRAVTRASSAVFEVPARERAGWQLPSSGYWSHCRPALHLTVACRKGGVLTGSVDGRRFADYGWTVKQGSTHFVSHWWSPEMTFHFEDDGLLTRGQLVSTRQVLSTPFRHVGLRLASLVLGRTIIGWLKRVFIFRRPSLRLSLQRSIRVVGDEVIVDDLLVGLKRDAVVEPATRASKRHVASADSFHIEDFDLHPEVEVERRSIRTKTDFRCRTVFR